MVNLGRPGDSDERFERLEISFENLKKLFEVELSSRNKLVRIKKKTYLRTFFF